MKIENAFKFIPHPSSFIPLDIPHPSRILHPSALKNLSQEFLGKCVGNFDDIIEGVGPGNVHLVGG